MKARPPLAVASREPSSVAPAAGPRLQTVPDGGVEQRIYDSVFDSVMGQRLPPGTKLPEAALCELFGVTRSVVRRVLQRLAHDHIVELRPNKGAVVDRLAQYLNVPPRQIATIGDQANDVLMFKRSGLSIAMGNASQEVQRQADFVTTSFGDEGFANAVDRFVLPRIQSEKEKQQT